MWRAHDKLMHRDVVVKRLPGGRSLDVVRSRMVRERAEGRVLGRLHHPAARGDRTYFAHRGWSTHPVRVWPR